MEKINEVVVVEGRHDTEKLKKYFKVDTIETNGSYLSEATIKLIESVNKERGIILLLDPDSVGEKIRNILNSRIPNLKNSFLFKEDCRTLKKVGVEHASYEVLKNALNSYFVYEIKSSLSRQDFIDLGLSGMGSNFKREIISRKFNLGKCNAKTIFKRLNMLGVTRKELEELL